MARIRTVKPDFFRHEGLQDLEAANVGKYPMLVFSGLWGHCDKSGRFEWRPRQLKLDILPFLNFDMADTLGLLESAGFVKRYNVGGKDYGFIASFSDHQRLSGKEASEPEKHPPPPETASGSNGEATGKQRGSTRDQLESQEGKGREEEGKRKGDAREGFPDAAQTTPPNPATAIIDLFDKAQAEIFNGERRAFPAGDDIVYAKRWSEAGIDLGELGGLFRSRLQAKKSSGERTIGSLRFFDAAVSDLMARKKSAPKIASAPPRRQRPQPEDVKRERDEQLKRFSES